MMQGGMPPPPPGKSLRHKQIKSHWIDSHAQKTNKKTEIVVDWYSHISGQPYVYTQGMPPPGRFCTLVHAEKYLNGEFKKKKKENIF